MEWNMKQNNLYFLISSMFSYHLCFYHDPNAPPPNTEFAAIGSLENPSI